MAHQLSLRLCRSTALVHCLPVIPGATSVGLLGRNLFYNNKQDVHCVDVMKTGRLSLRLSEKRVAKLKAYANHKDKTVTQLIEDWIDRLPLPDVLEASVPPASRSSSPP